MNASRRMFIAMTGAGAAGLASAGGAASAAPSGRLPLLATYVAGSDRYDAPRLPGLLKGAALALQREPSNSYDAKAVSVWTADRGKKLGYIPRIHNQALANLMDAGLATEVQVAGISGQAGRPDIAIAVSVTFPL